MPKAKRNKFAGADDIYLTKNSIAVRRVLTRKVGDGVYRVTDKTKYYPKTSSNLRSAGNIVGKIRHGR